MASDAGFLSRWAQRKANARRVADAEIAPPRPPAPDEPARSGGATGASATPVDPAAAPLAPLAPEAPPLPTLEDVARLTHASDFSPYVARNVDAGVRNAAMKKLFSDPHFNIMDGLDTYIDDYGKPDPIPPSMLRRMTQAASLGLFDEPPPSVPDDTIEGPLAAASPDSAGTASMAQSQSSPLPLAETPTRADDDPDLQLQRDDADRRSGAEPGPRG